jgi:serine protein kinase
MGIEKKGDLKKDSPFYHLNQVITGGRRFETVAESVSRMIFEKGVKTFTRGGQTVYDYPFFRQGKIHIVGWFDEINAFVNFVNDAKEGRNDADKMAFVLIGEPGNGKTWFVQYLCDRYKEFLARQENRRYTFEFFNLSDLGTYSKELDTIQSQTFEDPMVLAMNLFDSPDENIRFLEKLGFKEEQIEGFFRHYRPLGACSAYILNELKEFYGEIDKVLESIRIVPVPIGANISTITGKYSAGDKITSSAAELRGEEDPFRRLHLASSRNPYRLDVQKGALARVGGGGIHFADEIFKNKTDLVQIYLGVIQNRQIELESYIWYLDCLILATSNNWEYNKFFSEKEQAPLRDRFRTCFVSHNTDYKLQQELTKYALGFGKRTNVRGEVLHEDPNLNYTASVFITLTRLPHNEKLTPEETLKLEAGEVAGEKKVDTLIEVKEKFNSSPDVTQRWGQKGLGHRSLDRIFQVLSAMPQTNEGKCLFSKDFFKAAERVIYDDVWEATDRDKYLKDLAIARRLRRRKIKTIIYNAYRDDPEAIRKDMMFYIYMIIGITSDDLGPERVWNYKDPQSGERKAIKIDERYLDAVEQRMGLTTAEQKEKFRQDMRALYSQKIPTNPNYDFMDEGRLVDAVTEVRTDSEVATAASLVGALSDLTNEENVNLKNRIMETMIKKLGCCKTCALKTIEDYCTKEKDED